MHISTVDLFNIMDILQEHIASNFGSEIVIDNNSNTLNYHKHTFMSGFFIKVKNIKLYKRWAVVIFTVWYVAIFNSLSSCTSKVEDRKEKKQGKDFEAMVEETETMLEQSRKIAYGELTGNEPWILPSARIGGFQTRRIIEAGRDIANEAIKKSNTKKEARKGVGNGE